MTQEPNRIANLSTITKRVEALEEIERYDEAISLIHQGLLESPENALLLCHLSFCHFEIRPSQLCSGTCQPGNCGQSKWRMAAAPSWICSEWFRPDERGARIGA